MAMTNLHDPKPGTRNPELFPGRNRAKGFTILELLVVIFIMLAMAGIAVAAFGKFLDTERIKLAGGQVAGAIRMARQYAMSKRCKVMVEFVEPPWGSDSGVVIVDASDRAYVRGGSYKNTVYCASSAVKWAGGDTSSYHRRTLLKFDLTSFQGPGAVINSAKLQFDAATWNATDNFSVTFYNVGDGWNQATVTYNTKPASAGVAGACTVTKSEAKEVDITAAVNAEFGGDGFVSLEVFTNNGANGFNVNNPKLEIDYEWDTGVTKEEVAVIPRKVRVIPYIRDRNITTGGFTWLLDQDFNHLKEMELPRNIKFVLRPGMVILDQYDPGDLGDHRSTAKKIFFNLWPDGSCTALAPEVEGWTNRVNTVILHDSVTSDLALLFVPPASAFTRQRYLFGDEVEAFIAAHSLYSLW
jgi:Tfp pilus assembly protein FimT